MINGRAFLALGIAVSFMACKKDGIEVADLTSNPFDADYEGTAVFTHEDDTTTVESVGGAPMRVLTVEVRVHEELFGRPTTYQVQAGAPVNEMIPSNDVENGILRLRILNTTPGQQYCTQLRLGNSGAYGASNTVCATAE
ncbi:MAG: hypothetical protein JNM62_11160 [Flavobacteriales bacterium]|nr:hypothetical protein [Flavobacteriales bacterium]